MKEKIMNCLASIFAYLVWGLVFMATWNAVIFNGFNVPYHMAYWPAVGIMYLIIVIRKK